MNFLNPIVLAGLIAAGVPLMLHLISRRRAREISFPSIRLLMQMQTDRIRLLRLKQLMLLIIRTLIILLVVTGFARPALRSAFRAGARTAAVIVIDTSASMTAIDNGESLISRAKRSAADILGLLQGGDTAAVVVTTATEYASGTSLTNDKTELDEHIKNLEASHSSGDPTSTINAAMTLLSASRTVNNEIYYLTDRAINALPDSVAVGDIDNLRLYLVSIGTERRRGPVLNDLRLLDKVVLPGSPLTFVAEGSVGTDTDEVEVSFFVDGERKKKETVTPNATGQFRAECEYTPETSGWIDVMASTDNSGFTDGETRRLVIRIPEPVPVLIVEGSYTDGYFLERMLAPEHDDSGLVVSVTGEADITTSAITGASVIVLAGIRDMTDEVYRTLVTQVMRNGKGLIIIPPERTPAGLYDESIFRDLFPLGEYRNISFENRDGLQYTVIDHYDFTHPVMRGISQGGGFTYPQVNSYLAAEQPPGARVFARYSDGGMAAADMDCGNGRVILYTGNTNSLASELAFTGVFIPMFIRSVQYLSNTLPETEISVTGEPLLASFPTEEDIRQVTVKHDEHPAVRVSFSQNGLHAELDSYVPDEPGFYSVSVNDTERFRTGIDISRSEAESRLAYDSVLENRFRNVSWRSLDETDDILAAVSRDRFGTELAGLFLSAAFVLLALEMILARKA